jgi:hypothetical protein
MKGAAEVVRGGRLWFVFMGLGAPWGDGMEGMLVGVVAQQTAYGLYARSVSQRELLDAAAGGAQSSTVLVVDACFSGRTGTGAPLAPGLQPLIRVKDAGPVLKAGKSETAILSAGTSEQFAGPLPGANRPAFSYLVLGALRGWGDTTGTGDVSAQDAVDYAKLVMSVVPLGRSQTPELAAPNAKLILSRNAREKGPDLASIVTGSRAKPAAASSEQPTTAPRETSASVADQPTSPPPASTGGHTVFPWLVVGAGVASLVTGIVVGQIGAADKDQLQACQPSCVPGEVDAADTKVTVGYVLDAVGIAAIAGGVLWHFLEPVGPKNTTWRVQPAVGQRDAGFVFAGQF